MLTMAEKSEDKLKEVANATAEDTTETTEEDPTQVESTATFEPVVQLEEVEVRSGEEEEEVLLQMYVDLFVACLV